jgi:hypothetical protein
MYGGSKKLFDEIVDSGISESSVVSEISKGTFLPGSSNIFMKQKLESSDDEAALILRKHKKKSLLDSFTPILKKIKIERELSSDNETVEKDSSIDSENSPPPKKSKGRGIKATPAVIIKSESIEEFSNDSSRRMESKKKKKGKQPCNDDDDFESSLQILLNSKIKKEK